MTPAFTIISTGTAAIRAIGDTTPTTVCTSNATTISTSASAPTVFTPSLRAVPSAPTGEK